MCSGRPSAARMVASVDLHIAGNAEIAAMDVQRMGDAELLQRTRECEDDLPRRHAVIDVLLVEIELALIELEGADAARIDHLDRDRLAPHAWSRRRSP